MTSKLRSIYTRYHQDNGGKLTEGLGNDTNVVQVAIVPSAPTAEMWEAIRAQVAIPISSQWVIECVEQQAFISMDHHMVDRFKWPRDNLSHSQVSESPRTAANQEPPSEPLKNSRGVEDDNESEVSVALHQPKSPISIVTPFVPLERHNSQNENPESPHQRSEPARSPKNITPSSASAPATPRKERAYFAYAGAKRFFLTEADRAAMREHLQTTVRPSVIPWFQTNLTLLRIRMLQRLQFGKNLLKR